MAVTDENAAAVPDKAQAAATVPVTVLVDAAAVPDKAQAAATVPVTVLVDAAAVQERAAAAEIVAATDEVLLTDPLRASDAPAASSSRRSQCT